MIFILVNTECKFNLVCTEGYRRELEKPNYTSIKYIFSNTTEPPLWWFFLIYKYCLRRRKGLIRRLVTAKNAGSNPVEGVHRRFV